jgi:REP element-mobilizing transposase RayT
MILHEFGTIAYGEWTKLPQQFPNIDLDVFQIMPNHIHGILMLYDIIGQVSPLPPQGYQPKR